MGFRFFLATAACRTRLIAAALAVLTQVPSRAPVVDAPGVGTRRVARHGALAASTDEVAGHRMTPGGVVTWGRLQQRAVSEPFLFADDGLYVASDDRTVRGLLETSEARGGQQFA